MGVYFHSVGKDVAGDVERLALFASTVSESTIYFSMRDCLLANMSAPFPLTVGISYAGPAEDGRTVAMGFTGEDVLCPKLKEEILCGGGGGDDLVCGACHGFGEG